MQYLAEVPEIYDMMKSICQRAKLVENWVHARHKSYYTRGRYLDCANFLRDTQVMILPYP